MIGNFNAEESEPVRVQFLDNYNPVNVIHENTCYKSMHKPRCIGLTIINNPNSYQNKLTFCTGYLTFKKL